MRSYCKSRRNLATPHHPATYFLSYRVLQDCPDFTILATGSSPMLQDHLSPRPQNLQDRLDIISLARPSSPVLQDHPQHPQTCKTVPTSPALQDSAHPRCKTIPDLLKTCKTQLARAARPSRRHQHCNTQLARIAGEFPTPQNLQDCPDVISLARPSSLVLYHHGELSWSQ